MDFLSVFVRADPCPSVPTHRVRWFLTLNFQLSTFDLRPSTFDLRLSTPADGGANSLSIMTKTTTNRKNEILKPYTSNLHNG